MNLNINDTLIYEGKNCKVLGKKADKTGMLFYMIHVDDEAGGYNIYMSDEVLQKCTAKGTFTFPK